MSNFTDSVPSDFGQPHGKYSRLTGPIGVGLFAILVISAAILLLGQSQAERSVLRDVSAEHESDLLRFSEILHYSGLDLNGEDAREGIADLAQTSAFDTQVNRALFGLRAERMDIYALDGTAVYSTEGLENAPALNRGALEAFGNATAGQFTSLFRGGSFARDAFGANGDLLQSFALITDVPPDAVNSGRSLMVASITSDVSSELNGAFATVWLVVSIFFFGSLTILAAVHWASVRSRSRLQAANDALAVQNIAVRESRERMIAAADATKKAIAEELHGSVQTRLFSIWTRLSKMTSGTGQVDIEALTEIADELDDVRENDIRGLSHRLHPSIVRVGTGPALKSLCDRMSGDLEINLRVDDEAAGLEPLGSSPIPESLRLAIFRIAELAIGNTIKHASASRCEVTWSYSASEKALKLTVEDNGIGFDTGGLTVSEFGGLGIVNIQDYTDSFNGTAELKSLPGWGTTLTVRVPFERQAAPQSESVEVVKPKPASNITPFDQQKAA